MLKIGILTQLNGFIIYFYLALYSYILRNDVSSTYMQFMVLKHKMVHGNEGTKWWTENNLRKKLLEFVTHNYITILSYVQ